MAATWLLSPSQKPSKNPCDKLRCSSVSQFFSLSLSLSSRKCFILQVLFRHICSKPLWCRRVLLLSRSVSILSAMVHIYLNKTYQFQTRQRFQSATDALSDCKVFIWLVVWNMNFMTFHSVGNFIIPSDELIFFRGVAQPPMYIYIYTVYGLNLLYPYMVYMV